MKTFLFYFLIAAVFISVGWFSHIAWTLPKEISPVAEIKPRPLEKYEIEKLTGKYLSLPAPKIEMGRIIKEEKDFTSREFSITFDPTTTGGPDKKVTGLVNIPVNESGTQKLPTVMLFRGYVDQSIYETGMGSLRVGEFLAKNGYITIAPDFLGYGGSDSEAGNIFESRFQTYVTAINIFKAVGSWDKADTSNIFIWAHSNGGQIALTALEATGASYPTVLWAPNSAKFPYSILYYLDEAADNGKLIVTELSRFMADYDTDKFAFGNYVDKLRAPVSVFQGTSDEAIPTLWSENLVKKLEKAGVSATLTKYPGADHNMNPSWNFVIADTLTFFNTNKNVQ